MASQVVLAQVSVPTDTTLPRDAMVITPHFQDTDGTSSYDTLSNQLATNVASYLGVAAPVTVKVYVATNPKPNPPVSTYTKNPAGATVTSSTPREVALALSYYSGFNRPGYRGRLYIPFTWLTRHLGTGSLGQRPTNAQQLGVQDFVTSCFTPLKAGGWWWSMHSKARGVHTMVSNYWIDDEWDTQRRRGLRATTRVNGTFTP